MRIEPDPRVPHSLQVLLKLKHELGKIRRAAGYNSDVKRVVISDSFEDLGDDLPVIVISPLDHVSSGTGDEVDAVPITFSAQIRVYEGRSDMASDEHMMLTAHDVERVLWGLIPTTEDDDPLMPVPSQISTPYQPESPEDPHVTTLQVTYEYSVWLDALHKPKTLHGVTSSA